MSADESDPDGPEGFPGDDEVPPPECYSLFRYQRLVAYVSRRAGMIRRAGAAEGVCDCAYADVEVFEPRELELFVRLAEEKKSVDAYVFALGMEGLEVQEGLRTPHGGLRRF